MREEDDVGRKTQFKGAKISIVISPWTMDGKMLLGVFLNNTIYDKIINTFKTQNTENKNRQ